MYIYIYKIPRFTMILCSFPIGNPVWGMDEGRGDCVCLPGSGNRRMSRASPSNKDEKNEDDPKSSMIVGKSMTHSGTQN